MTASQPYPGLRPFYSYEADIFFGREEHTDDLLRKLERHRFLAVTGPSGCGKSSLVRAGMIPALETGFMVSAGPRWRIAVMRPGSQPIVNLADSLLQDCALGNERVVEDSAREFLSATLRRGPLALSEALTETPLPPRTNLLVLVDQFEEIFRFRRLDRGNEADSFVSLLVESAAQRELPIYVVITMRSDYIGDCALFKGLPEVLNESQYLTPRLTRDQRRSAVLNPARVFGGDIEPELLNRVLNESGTDPDQLPVLQHVLMRMWTYGRAQDAHAPGWPSPERKCPTEQETGDTGRILTLADYEAVGGFGNALSRHADEAFLQLTPKQKDIAELMFRRMCERGEGRQDIRRPSSVSEIAELASATLGNVTAQDVFEVAEVFRSPHYGFLVPHCPEPLHPETILDITHESLIRRWVRLNKWVEQEAQSAETYRYLDEAAGRWKAGRGALWGTPDLENALEWKQREHPTVSWSRRYGGNFEVAAQFLAESEQKQAGDRARADAESQRELEYAKREAVNARKRARRTRLYAVIFAVLALAACAGLLYAVVHKRRSESRELAAAARANLTLDPERSVWLALHALNKANTPEAQDAVQMSAYASHVKLTLNGHRGAVSSAAFSPDGRRVITGGHDGTTRIWDSQSGRELQSFRDHREVNGNSSVAAVAWNPKRPDMVASVGADGFVHIKNLKSGTHLAPPEAHQYGASSVDFSPTGDKIATAGYDGFIIVRDVQSGKMIGSSIDTKIADGIADISFCPDGGHIASAGVDGSWAIWEAPNPKHGRVAYIAGYSREMASIYRGLSQLAFRPESEIPHSAAIVGIEFNPGGKLLVTASEDRTVKIWDVEKRSLLRTVSGHATDLRKAVFSPDGLFLATASGDMTTKIWNLVSGQQLLTLAGHSAPLTDVEFSPDGRTLLTSSEDGTAKIWNIEVGHTDQVFALAFSPNGDTLASAGLDWTAKLWKVPSMEMEHSFHGHYASVSSIAFLPDGNRIVTGSRDKALIMWDARTAKRIWEGNHNDEVISLSISTDHHLIASASREGTIALWTFAGEEIGKRTDLGLWTTAIAFQPRKSLLAVAVNAAGQGEVLFLDIPSRVKRDIGILPTHPDGIVGMTFSDDGRMFAIAGGNDVKLWDLSSQRELHALHHTAPVASLGFSRDGNLLATASWDQTAQVWDVATGTLRHTYTHPGAVNAVEFSPDGKYLATACDDHLVRLLPLDLEALKKFSRSRLTQVPRTADCRKYLRVDVCPADP